jgi:hypothetical protein
MPRTFTTLDGTITIALDRVDYTKYDPDEDWLEIFLFGNSLLLAGEDAAQFMQAFKLHSKNYRATHAMGGVA